MENKTLKTTEGEIIYISRQTSGFNMYRFGIIRHKGKSYNLSLEKNKFLGILPITGDEAIEHLTANKVFPLNEDGSINRSIADFLFKST